MARFLRVAKACLWTVAGGLYLVGLYLLVVLVVISLSVLQFRSTVGENFSFRDIPVAQERLAAQEKTILEQAGTDPAAFQSFNDFLGAQDMARAQIEALRSAERLYPFFDTYNFYVDEGWRYYLDMPSSVLIFVVTIFMGALGSLIAMTWSFIRGDGGMTLRRFLILPLVGGSSAFIVLIFLKAGQLTLTAGATADQLDPFVLSFFGIISGLLSERAYQKISQIGGNVFSIEDRQPRWGVGLPEKTKAAGVEIDELADHLGTDIEEAERIVDGRIPATLDQQRLMSALLRQSRRELFTDIPPVWEHAKTASADAGRDRTASAEEAPEEHGAAVAASGGREPEKGVASFPAVRT